MHKKVLQLRCTGQLLGAERVILELGKELPPLGYESVVGVPVEQGMPEPELVCAAKALGYEVVVFPIKGAFDLSALTAVKKYVQDNNIDIVHSHGYREDLYALKCRSLAKLVATNHLWKRTDWKLSLYAKLDAFLLKFFHHIVAVSKPVKIDMLNEGLKDQKITLVQNGIDTAHYAQKHDTAAIKASLGIEQDATVLATLSSLTGEKAIDVAIKAFAALPEQSNKLTLLVIGDGPERDNLQQLAHKLGCEKRVVFAGRRSDISALLSCVDLFVLSSLAEGLPMALLEAMASGCAVIATAVGDVPDVVDTSVGRLIEAGDSQALTNAMQEIVYDSAALKRYGNAAKNRIEQQFSSKAMASGYAAIYNKLLNAN